MRASLLAISLLVFTCYQVFGQQAFERAYPGQNSAMDWSVTYSVLDNTLWYAVVENTDIILHHLDASGNITSTYRYANISAYEVSIEQSVNGNIYLSGMCSSNPVGYYLLALDFTGSVIWTKKYATSSLMSYANSKIRTLNNGNVMIVESVYGHLGYIEVDGNTGAVVNSVQLREDTTVENKTPGFAGDIHGDGSFVFTGKRGNDIAVVRTTAQGNVMWSSVLNSSAVYYHTKGVAACTDGSTIACGMENYNGFIMKMDANGAVQWYNSFNGGMIYYDVKQIDANTLGACGSSGSEFIYSRFDMNGNEIGTIRFVHPGFQFSASELKVNAGGTVAIPFSYVGGPTIITQPGLMLLEPNFNFECGMIYEQLTPSTTSFDPSALNVPIYSMEQEVTVTNVVCSPSVMQTGITDNMCIILGTDLQETVIDLQLQNNPSAQGQCVTFSLGDYRGDIAYRVTDALGREVSNAVIAYGGGNQPIENSGQLSPGVYLFTTYINGSQQTERFVIR